MRSVVAHGLSTAELEAVRAMVTDVEHERGYRPMSDQAWLDLNGAAHDHVVQVLVQESHNDDVLAYAQANVMTGLWSIELVVARHAQHLFGTVATTALKTAIDGIEAVGGHDFVWLVQDPTTQHEALASALELAIVRRLYQMRCELPVDVAFEIATRPFDPDRDVDEWVRVNARAFAWNPEQGSWTADAVRARIGEPWFDPNGFLVFEIEGRMAGFCWTKIHPPTTSDEALGEIYVIAVDPEFHGRGYGRDLTLAGLRWLAGRGVRTGMLFVDSDNVAAIRLYKNLGFRIHRTDCMYLGHIEERPE
ncbi:MAG TPA: mycothiol synthase [Ilumatobacteraceae bacterium]|jgi:mycothiol synthase